MANNVCCLNPACSQPLNPSKNNYCESCGTKIAILRNRYKPVALLSNEGGFGRTYLAEDLDRLSIECVIKQLVPQVQGTGALKKATELFAQEARQLEALGEHPQIPQLLAYFEEGGYLYLIQQYIKGKTLDKLVNNGVWNEEEIKQFLLDILPVLELIHSKNIIHRDLKPSNIIKRENNDQYVLIDFGASKELSQTMATNATKIGTFGYAAKEQLTEGEAFPSSDLYGLGVICFYLLTKENPSNLYIDEGYQWLNHWKTYLKQPLSNNFKQILSKLLQKDYQKRFQSATEVLESLNCESTTISSPFLSPQKQLQQKPQSKPFRPNPSTTIQPTIEISYPPTPSPIQVQQKNKLSKFTAKQTLITSVGAILLGLGLTQIYGVVYLKVFPVNPIFAIKIFPQGFIFEKMLKGNPDGVLSFVAFSPDGNYLAINSNDDTIKIRKVSSGKLIHTLTGNFDRIDSVFSPDGNYFASGSLFVDNTIKIWEVNSGNLIHTLTGHSHYVRSVAFSADGNYLASGSIDDIIKIWEVSSGNLIHTLTGHSSSVESLAFSADGNYLASANSDKTVKIWEVNSGNLIHTLTGHSYPVESLAFSPDGNYLATGSGDNTIKIWEVSSGNLIHTLTGHSGTVYGVAFSPDGDYLASASVDTIKIWEVSSGKLIRTLTAAWASVIDSVAFSPDGNYLFGSSNITQTVQIWRWR